MPQPRIPFVIGLTGGIGSGKSAAADLFASLGASVVDADDISRNLTGPDGGAMPALRLAFGDAIATAANALDRAAMRQRAFSDPEAKRTLEAILHPMIREASRQQCATATGPYVMLVVPLLLEAGNYRERVARVAVVDCPEEIQVARVMSRSQLSEEEVKRIMAAQASRAARLAAADDVISNDGSLEELETQVRDLHLRYLAMARDASSRA